MNIPWRYNSGALLSDEEVPGLTQDLEPDNELRRIYGGRFMICESLGEEAARRIAQAFGRDLVVGPEVRV